MKKIANLNAENYYAEEGDIWFEKYARKLETQSVYPNVSTLKRAFDFFFSFLFLLLVASWLFPLISILIKLNSKGPIFFVQDRIGINGSGFKCYKFRTMRVDDGRYMYTPIAKGNQSITRIGAFLRKTNLDEMPQFINVLLGDMSIVGPRPHAIPFHQTYASFIDFIDFRHLVKPGITGLAQIKGYRGDVTDFEENKMRTIIRIKYDVQYIRIWSFKLDMIIVWKTALQMLGGKTNGH